MASGTRSAGKSVKLPRELKVFCERLGITKYVPVALRLVRESFLSASEPALYAECDPETGEEWLVIETIVKGTLEDVHEQYQKYTRHKVERIPWPQRDAIRLMHRYEAA